MRCDRLSRSLSPWLVGALHVLGWGGLLLVVLRGDGAHSGTAIGLGLGATAYALGLRHAFDADHIATIDNTTRRLLAADRPARNVGMWFSFGHSTVVMVLCVLLTLGLRTVASSLTDEHSSLHLWTGTIGPVVSGVFLLLIAATNLVGLVRRSRGAHGHSHAGGPVTALLERLGTVIDRPSKMYGVGFLFGLGFDTATEIGLLALAGAASVGQVPWWAVLTLPILFTAGMSLLDSAQGAMSRAAYGWRSAGAGSVRRYDLIVTGVSVVAALTIGVVELAGVVSAWAPAGWASSWLRALGSVDINEAGFVLTGVLLVAWGIAAAVTARTQRA
jgi:nickel/cobalt transporter (NiCoT) family protein